MAKPGYTGSRAREYDRRNPVFTGSNTGVAANHSSTEPATMHSANVGHEQQDDDLDNVPRSQDPNISGTPEMEPMYTWQAGRLDGWQENDDYRRFFERSIGCDGMLADYRDNDYDDNGGIPTRIGDPVGIPGMYEDPTMNPDGMGGYSLGPVIARRL